jgi:hypothetical protein
MNWREFSRRAHQILHEAQRTLLPEQASKIVAINVDNGEYVVAATLDAVHDEFRKRWPGKISYVARADGGPVVKFHGK